MFLKIFFFHYFKSQSLNHNIFNFLLNNNIHCSFYILKKYIIYRNNFDTGVLLDFVQRYPKKCWSLLRPLKLQTLISYKVISVITNNLLVRNLIFID